MKKLTIDFETRSAADLKKMGAAAYAQHPTTEVICLALKWKDGEPVIWYSPNFRYPEISKGIPAKNLVKADADVKAMVDSADVIEAHNAQF